MDAPLPADPLTCARLASALILATANAPDHPLLLGTRDNLASTVGLIERLLARASLDPDLRARVTGLSQRWTDEAARLGLHRR